MRTELIGAREARHVVDQAQIAGPGGGGLDGAFKPRLRGDGGNSFAGHQAQRARDEVLFRGKEQRIAGVGEGRDAMRRFVLLHEIIGVACVAGLIGAARFPKRRVQRARRRNVRDEEKFELADIVHGDGGVGSGDRREQRVIGRHSGGGCELRLRVAKLQEQLRAGEYIVVGAGEPIAFFGRMRFQSASSAPRSLASR